MNLKIPPLLYCTLLIVAFLALTGCLEFKDGYQFGDITRFTVRELAELEQARQDYCSATSTSLTRKAALITIRTKVPDYPEDGICTEVDGSNNTADVDTVSPLSRFNNNLIRADPTDPLPA